LVLVLNLVATLYMTGLIWFVQVVHYPLFASVGEPGFAAYSQRHQSLTTMVVGPPMLLEALTAGLLLLVRPAGIPAWTAWAGVTLVGAIWISTAALQIPAHARLASGLDLATVRDLVGTNWIRTAGWSLRAMLASWMVLVAMRPSPAS
ncbi:MAG: hypothetical protein ACKO0W_01870, partial [Planctomycetota bacterium]